jgi:sugar-specific transcriptional regulator TrmB
MDREQINQMLKKLGLTEYESKVYSTLVLTGPSRVGELSRQSGVPQAKIYGVLDKLIDKNMVEVFGVKPKEFKAISPDVILRELLENKESELKELKVNLKDLISILKPMDTSSQLIDGIWAVKGKKHTEWFSRLISMFEKSEKYMYLITRDFTWSSNLAEAFKSAIKRKVQIRTVAIKEITEDNFYRAEWFSSRGADIRLFKTKIHPRIIVVDGKEVLMRLDQNPTKFEKFPFTAVWSADQSLVAVFDSYLKNLWSMSEKLNFKEIRKKLKTSKEFKF